MVATFISMVRGVWLALSDIGNDEEWEALLRSVKLYPSSVRKTLLRVLNDGVEFEETEMYKAQVPTALWEATRWICALNFPETEDELWHGPRIVDRPRLDPTRAAA